MLAKWIEIGTSIYNLDNIQGIDFDEDQSLITIRCTNDDYEETLASSEKVRHARAYIREALGFQ